MREKWVDIPKFKGIYQVSDLGRIRSRNSSTAWHSGKPTKHWKVIRPYTLDGYSVIRLYAGQKATIKRVNRLVLEVFVGRRKHMEAAHLNSVRSDNRLSNLRWSTPKENQQHRILQGNVARGEDNANAKLTELHVKAIRFCSVAFSQRNLAKIFSMSSPTIRSILQRKTWRHVK